MILYTNPQACGYPVYNYVSNYYVIHRLIHNMLTNECLFSYIVLFWKEFD